VNTTVAATPRYSQLDLTREQRQQIGKLMGEQMHDRKQLVEKYLDKLPAADQKALKDEMPPPSTTKPRAISAPCSSLISRRTLRRDARRNAPSVKPR
jgi:Spy/CpxP family protein refolding chaperone